MGTASSDEGELYSETNGTISWIVVDNDDHYGNGGVTLVSEYVLTEGTFGSNGNLYQDSNIRSWLRNDFVNYFLEEESKFLLVTSYESSNDYSNITAIQLEDKFYLLSEAEVNGGFMNMKGLNYHISGILPQEVVMASQMIDG